jgi:hypothetical protein
MKDRLRKKVKSFSSSSSSSISGNRDRGRGGEREGDWGYLASGSPIGVHLCPSVVRILSCGTLFALWAFAVLNCAGADLEPTEKIPPLRPPRGEIPPSFWEQHGGSILVWTVVGLGVIGAAIWFLMRPKAPVVVAPEAAARKALEKLREYPEDGAVLSRVSQVLRYYVTNAFELPQGEMTTAEFSRAITGHPRLGPALAQSLSDFLRACDERKFAHPSGMAPLDARARALELVEAAERRRAEILDKAA